MCRPHRSVVLAAPLLELTQQFGIGVVELGGHHHLDMRMQVAAHPGAQMRHAMPAQCGDRSGLSARGDGQFGGAIEDRIDHHGRALGSIDGAVPVR